MPGWLVHNPVADMAPTSFLLVYAICIIAAVMVGRALIGFRGGSLPRIDLARDPYEIVYLRGGVNEVARYATFDLTRRGFLHVGGGSGESTLVERAPQAPDPTMLGAFDRAMWEWYANPRTATEIFSSGSARRMETLCSPYRATLEREGLLRSGAIEADASRLRTYVTLAIALLGGYRLYEAIAKEHRNLGLLIAMLLAGVVLAQIVLRVRRVTPLGRRYLRTLATAVGPSGGRGFAVGGTALAAAPFVVASAAWLCSRALRTRRMRRHILGPRAPVQAAAGRAPESVVRRAVRVTAAVAAVVVAVAAVVVGDSPTRMRAGVSFHREFSADLYATPSRVDVLEVIADHYLTPTSARSDELELLASSFELVPHGLDLSIGSADGIDRAYLRRVAQFVERIAPPWYSEHLAFTRAGGARLGHLAPLQYTRESLNIVVANIEVVVRALGVPLVLENITAPFVFASNECTEAVFFCELYERTGTRILLDVANLHTNAVNLGIDPYAYLAALPKGAVVELHLAGGEWLGDELLDSHSAPISQATWDLAHEACARFDISVAIVERDEKIPQLAELLADVDHVRTLAATDEAAAA